MMDLSLYKTIVEHAVEGIMVTDPEGNIEMVNPSFTRITGYDSSEAIGNNPSFLKSGLHHGEFFADMWTVLEKDGWWQGEIWNRRKSGDIFVEAATIKAIQKPSGEITNFVSIFSDITERKTIEGQIQKDLQLAKQIQRFVISPPLSENGITIDSVYLPSDTLGGDMYAWYPILPTQYGIFLMDVMGHGVAASLVSMSIRSLLQGLMTRLVEPSEVMRELNQHMRGLYYRESNRDIPLYFLTALYMVIDTQKRQIQYVNAGHPPAILQGPEGDIRLLDQGGIPIGVMDEHDAETHTLTYEASSQLLLFTDGLLEAVGDSVQLGIQQLCELMDEYLGGSDVELTQHIVQSVVSNGKHADDICLISVSLHEH